MIFAVDPGPTQSAFVLWDGEKPWSPRIVPNDLLIPLIPLPTHADPNVIVAVEHLQCFGLAVGAEVKAKDANIRQALLDRFGGREKAIGKKKSPGPLHGVHGDMWSALAIAITAYDTKI